MSRFLKNLAGEYGEWWKRHAEEELEKVCEDILNGKITFDENGVAYNCIGRILMDDMAEKVELVSKKINRENTRKAREIKDRQVIQEYCEWRKKHGYSEEELAEMRAAFGNETVVDIFTGEVVLCGQN